MFVGRVGVMVGSQALATDSFDSPRHAGRQAGRQGSKSAKVCGINHD